MGMHNGPLLQILILLAASVCVVAGVRKLKLPAILGYLAVGMLLGPHALALAVDNDTTRLLADFGVVFLVFTLGLEFSLPRLVAMRWEVLGVGGAQVLVTTGVVAAVAIMVFDIAPAVAIVIGGAVAMSSTAIIISQLTEQSENNRTHGRLAVAICLFQDLSFPLLLGLVSALAGAGQRAAAPHIAAAIGFAAFALLLVLAAGRWLLRPLFLVIAGVRSPELFSLAVLLAVLASAWATQAAGLSLALGAFLAGMMLAETEFRHQIEATIRSYREVLLGLFFITVGMLLDVAAIAAHLAAGHGDPRGNAAAQGLGRGRCGRTCDEELVQIPAHGCRREPGRGIRLRTADSAAEARVIEHGRGSAAAGCHRAQHGGLADADPPQSAHHPRDIARIGPAPHGSDAGSSDDPRGQRSAITW